LCDQCIPPLSSPSYGVRLSARTLCNFFECLKSSAESHDDIETVQLIERAIDGRNTYLAFQGNKVAKNSFVVDLCKAIFKYQTSLIGVYKDIVRKHSQTRSYKRKAQSAKDAFHELTPLMTPVSNMPLARRAELLQAAPAQPANSKDLEETLEKSAATVMETASKMTSAQNEIIEMETALQIKRMRLQALQNAYKDALVTYNISMNTHKKQLH